MQTFDSLSDYAAALHDSRPRVGVTASSIATVGHALPADHLPGGRRRFTHRQAICFRSHRQQNDLSGRFAFAPVGVARTILNTAAVVAC